MSSSGLPARPVLLAAIAVVALVLVWQLGQHQGRQAVVNDNELLLTTMQGAEEDLNRVTRERDVALAAEIALRDRLSEATRLSVDEKAELELYRRISEASSPVGLGVDAISYTPGEGDGLLAITIVQSRGRDRVVGAIRVSVMQGGEALVSIDTLPDGGPVGFDLRFFETISLPLALADIEGAEAVVVVVTPEGDAHEEITVERAWNLVSE